MADTSQPHSSRCPAWLRECGLYLSVSGVVTVLKYVLLLFLPRAFAFSANARLRLALASK